MIIYRWINGWHINGTHLSHFTYYKITMYSRFRKFANSHVILLFWTHFVTIRCTQCLWIDILDDGTTQLHMPCHYMAMPMPCLPPPLGSPHHSSSTFVVLPPFYNGFPCFVVPIFGMWPYFFDFFFLFLFIFQARTVRNDKMMATTSTSSIACRFSLVIF